MGALSSRLWATFPHLFNHGCELDLPHFEGERGYKQEQAVPLTTPSSTTLGSSEEDMGPTG